VTDQPSDSDERSPDHDPAGASSTREHRRAADALAARSQPVRAAVITVSDTRTIETDEGGALIVRRLTSEGHDVVSRAITRDDPAGIDALLVAALKRGDTDVIITTGGTGISRRDTTIEVVRRHLTTELDGFGELFRMISYEAIGPAAMLSRAAAGLAVYDRDRPGTFLFALPGSVHAVATALDRLILPELAHLIFESRR